MYVTVEKQLAKTKNYPCDLYIEIIIMIMISYNLCDDENIFLHL